MSEVILKNISKLYSNGFNAVKNINIDIKDKEFIVLVGPSGCGKSTTLRMIAGLEEISEGELYIGDKLVNNIEPKDRDIAMVFQNYALYPHLSVYENMAFALKLRKLPKDEIDKKVKEAAKILDLLPLLNKKPKTLSGGQRQRAWIAMTLAQETDIIMLDEPTTYLDMSYQLEVLQVLEKLNKEKNITIIMVLHELNNACRFASNIIGLKKGKVICQGTPMEAITKENLKEIYGIHGKLQLSENKNYPICIDYELIGG